MKMISIVGAAVFILTQMPAFSQCAALADEHDEKTEQTESVKKLLAEIASDNLGSDELKKKVKMMRDLLPLGTTKDRLNDVKEIRRLLFLSFPALIKLMDGNLNNDSYIIMTSVQTSCPAPKREIWDQWLQKVKDADSVIWCWPVH